MAGLLQDTLIGTVAGLASTRAMERVSSYIYEHTNPEDTRREQELRPGGRPPAEVLTQKVEARLNLNLSEQQKSLLANAFHFGTGIVPAILYVLAARRSRLGWFANGLIFGLLFTLIVDEGVASAMGLVGDNRKYPLEAHLRGLAAHTAFGLTAAALVRALGVSRSERVEEETT